MGGGPGDELPQEGSPRRRAMGAALQPAADVARKLKLWLSLEEDERSFERTISVDVELHVRAALGFSFYFLVAALSGIVLYVRESSSASGPFRWEARDPRTAHFALQLCAVGVAAAAAVTSVCWHRSSWELERLWMAAAASVIVLNYAGSCWNVAHSFGRDPAEVWSSDVRGSEQAALGLAEAVTLGTCLCLPIRRRILWMLPALSFVCFLVLSLRVGSPFPDELPLTAGLLLVVSVCTFQMACSARATAVKDATRPQPARGAHVILGKAENHKEELRQLDVATRIQALKEVQSDTILKLSIDLRIFGSGPREEAFFGRRVEGRLITDFLPSSCRGRFVRVLTRAHGTGSVHVMPAKLLCRGVAANRRLAVVDTGCAEPRYLVGIISSGSVNKLPPFPGLPNTLLMPSELDRDESNSEMSPILSDAVSSVYTLTAAFNESPEPYERDAAVQAQEPGQDCQVATVVQWGNQAVRCRCNDPSSRPSEAAAMLAGRKDVKNQPPLNPPPPSGPFDGRWTLAAACEHDVAVWLKNFALWGDEGIDGVGNRFKLHHENGRTLLKGGVLVLQGGVLHRKGKSGNLLRFVRFNDGQGCADEDDDEDDRDSLFGVS